MSLTLGEKLRQAREERGISISEVAEQTRISPHYLDSIENDDYRTLPGGIFNKGFVKSYAKYVGLDEQEALQDYSHLIASQEGGTVSEEPKTYKPEVLTDDRTSGSTLPTIIFAAIILGLMAWGLIKLVDYIQNQQSQPAANANTAGNSNTANINANAANA
ncbi:MAG TPA: helix-turn-helix domain-containing protein, partial [Pyrinomonadaceae bacterium]